MTASQLLSPQIVGRAENAHKPILDRILAEASCTKEQWVALTLVAAQPDSLPRGAVVQQMVDALKIEDRVADVAVSDLLASKDLRGATSNGTSVELTESGMARYTRIRSAIGEVVGRVYGAIPDEDLVTSARVLTQITDRLNLEFGPGRSTS
jgi:hypothetical protein